MTTKGEKSGTMKDSEIPTVIDFPSSFSVVGFERSLPSLVHLLKVDPHIIDCPFLMYLRYVWI